MTHTFFKILSVTSIVLLMQACSGLVKDNVTKANEDHAVPVENSVNSQLVAKNTTPKNNPMTVTILPSPNTNTTPIPTFANSQYTQAVQQAQANKTIDTTPTNIIQEYDDLWVKTVAYYGLAPVQNQRVITYIKHYQKKLPKMERVFARTQLFYHHVLTRILEEGLPAEIALLPIIESHYNTFGYSHSNAAGAWKFMPSTGSMFGLERNWWFDGRRDIVASTDAAIKYLKQLNDTFSGDWLLALAAYNAGPGTVQRSIKRNIKKGLPTDYWSLTLPKETMHYVPKFLGLAQTVKQHAGTKALPKIANRPYFEVIKTDSQLDLAVASEMAGIDLELMYQLNSGYNQWATDPQGPHHLNIPVKNAKRFRQGLVDIPKEDRIVWDRYTIKPGDNLLSIAKKYHLSVSTIKSLNSLVGDTIYAGKTLFIPIASKKALAFSISSSEVAKRLRALPNIPARTIVHKVKSGENLWLIAKKYQVRVNEITRWNKLSANALLQVGQKLSITL